jgi:hypothetical protein
MLSLEWRIGKKEVSVRQYAVEEVADGELAGGAHTDAGRFNAFGGHDLNLTRPLLALMEVFGGATEDVAVTSLFDPEAVALALSAPGGEGKRAISDLVQVSNEKSKIGLKLFKTKAASAESDAALLKLLLPAFDSFPGTDSTAA